MNGIIVGGFGLGAFVFNQVCLVVLKRAIGHNILSPQQARQNSRIEPFFQRSPVMNFHFTHSEFQVQSRYLNPENEELDEDGYFSDDRILNRVPSVFLLLGSLYGIIQVKT